MCIERDNEYQNEIHNSKQMLLSVLAYFSAGIEDRLPHWHVLEERLHTGMCQRQVIPYGVVRRTVSPP